MNIDDDVKYNKILWMLIIMYNMIHWQLIIMKIMWWNINIIWNMTYWMIDIVKYDVMNTYENLLYDMLYMNDNDDMK